MTWKNFKNWLEREIVIQEGLKIKLRPEKQRLYGEISEINLTNFMDSLEATLDKISSYHQFPEFASEKSFQKLFSADISFGKKTNKVKIIENEYSALEKLFNDWKSQSGIFSNTEEKRKKFSPEVLNQNFQDDYEKFKESLIKSSFGDKTFVLKGKIRNKKLELAKKAIDLKGKMYHQELLDIMLEFQELFTRLFSHSDSRAIEIVKNQLQITKRDIFLEKDIKIEEMRAEIETICQLKDQLTKMEMELNEIAFKEINTRIQV
jgi:hypothetical protein